MSDTPSEVSRYLQILHEVEEMQKPPSTARPQHCATCGKLLEETDFANVYVGAEGVFCSRDCATGRQQN